MERQHRAPIEHHAKPSRFVMLLALCIAFSLPYVLVKTFSHPQKAKLTNQPLSLPKPKKTVETTAEQPIEHNEWQTVETQNGDSLATVFSRLGLSAKTLHAIMKDNPHAKTLSTLKPNQKLQFLIYHKTLEKLIVPLTTTQSIVVYRDADVYRTKINSRKMDSHNHYVTATVKGSLYNTAKRFNIPYQLIRQMTDIFNWEIDFSKDVRAGDQFTMIYKAFYIDDKLVGTGEIIAVTYTTKNNSYQAIRHTNAQGESDYFTPQGISLKKAFTRYPVNFSHISSTFSLSREHPILHYKRPHKGIDLAAPLGTPIRATGDGVIEIIDRHNGYGNMIKIKHNKTYSTVYAHMLKFQKGLSKGSKVKRGQIIGYVGQSGLATGPHCHYEFHINKKPKNPTTVHLPQADSVPAKELASFKANANSLLAHLKLFEEAYLASADKNKATIG